jgi:hypothetical protein
VLTTLLEVALRGAAFLGTRVFADAVFFLAAGLLFAARRDFAAFRDKVFLGTALFALGRVGFVTARRFAAGFEEDRLEDARDVERLSPFETALMRSD